MSSRRRCFLPVETVSMVRSRRMIYTVHVIILYNTENVSNTYSVYLRSGETNFMLHGSHLPECAVFLNRANNVACRRCRTTLGQALRRNANPNTPSGDSPGDVIALKFYMDAVAFTSRESHLASKTISKPLNWWVVFHIKSRIHCFNSFYFFLCVYF